MAERSKALVRGASFRGFESRSHHFFGPSIPVVSGKLFQCEMCSYNKQKHFRELTRLPVHYLGDDVEVFFRNCRINLCSTAGWSNACRFIRHYWCSYNFFDATCCCFFCIFRTSTIRFSYKYTFFIIK